MKRSAWLSRALLMLSLCAMANGARAQDVPAASDGGLPPDTASDPPLSPLPTEAGPAPVVDTLSEAELENLGLDVAGPRVDTDFHFWGFADFSSYTPIKPNGIVSTEQGRYQSFYVGNVNLYLSKNLSESFRTMAEVRFTYLPNGNLTSNASGVGYLSTATLDYANGLAQTNWGGIIMQRIYLEWTLHRFITVRGGQYLTPFGIWNVDHGSPAYIPAQRPYTVVSGFFPERQTGLEMFGRWSPTNESTLGYHLTISNGGGPISEYKDLDRNKAVGGRAYWERYGKSSFFRIGTSGYYGRNTSATPTVSILPTTVELGQKVTSQSDSLVLAADVQYKVGGLSLQAEWVSRQQRYTDQGRTFHPLVGATAATAASADSFSWSGYGLAAYRFGWYGLTPYLLGERVKIVYDNFAIPDAKVALLLSSVGLNVNPIDAVFFKAQYSHVDFLRKGVLFRGHSNFILLQAAWAF